ncbi:MAG: exodeoxyribonuclease V subunit alpha [Desulfobacterales bacterium]|jgi:exodeoxyribonuclease V alpha subunit
MLKRNTIKSLLQKGLLSEIDIQFAKFISGLSPDNDPHIFLAAALVSHTTASGNICLNLEKTAGNLLAGTPEDRESFECPQLDVWLEKLKTHPAVGRPGEKCPLILDAKNRFYLYRYWDYENTLSKSIEKRICINIADLDFQRLKHSLDRLFPKSKQPGVNWQKIAAAVASLRHFSVITGGPGTGKTFTVTQVLALLMEQAPGKRLQIYLAAPTGKAAARLKESLEHAKSRMNCDDEVKARLPADVFTIHRMLKPIKGSPYFRHDSDNPLMADVVVVDEASMVDLALMAKLFRAVPQNARLILIGDKDQLASVEAGSVLGDICDREVMHGFSDSFMDRIKELTGEDLGQMVQASDEGSRLQDSIVVLQKSYRFAAGSGIGGLSRAVNRADTDRAFAILDDSEEKSINWLQLKANEDLIATLSHQIVSGYKSYLKTRDPADALQRLRRFKILCALNIGPLGAQAINKLAEQVLSRQNLIQLDPMAENPWYAGRPVLITRNNYQLGLFNGDIGITLPAAEAREKQLFVYFPDDTGGVRRFQIHQLPEHETVYAMTVHKSQGSEFDEVLFILPDKAFSILTRELIYTALTRARRKIRIWGNRSIIRNAIAQKIERTSGLRDALWGAGNQMSDDRGQKTESK